MGTNQMSAHHVAWQPKSLVSPFFWSPPILQCTVLTRQFPFYPSGGNNFDIFLCLVPNKGDVLYLFLIYERFFINTTYFEPNRNDRKIYCNIFPSSKHINIQMIAWKRKWHIKVCWQYGFPWPSPSILIGHWSW